MRKIIIHYHRHDEDYKPWGVWLWPEGYGGQWLSFCAQDSYGQIATCEFPREHERFGFVIRGKSWEKDVDHDRYLDDFIGDQAEIWLVAGDPRVYLAPPAHLRHDLRAFASLNLTIHYYRYDEDYTDWGLWLWEMDTEGFSLDFTGEDDYGKIAQISLSQQTDGGELGFVLRKGSQNQPWVEKDGDQDRYIPFYRANANGDLSIWLMQGDPKLYYRAEDVKREPYLVRALLNDLQTVEVVTYLPVQNTLGAQWGFQLKSGLETIPLKKVRSCRSGSKQTTSFYLKTQEPLDLTKQYQVEHTTHGLIELSFGQVFSSSIFAQEFHYDGEDLGANYSPEATIFKVWAPTARKLTLVLYSQAEQKNGREIPLNLAEKGVWQGKVLGDLEGQFYQYKVTHGKESSFVVDPYARSSSINGELGQIVDLSKTNPRGFKELPWLSLENPVDAVIYEAHVRDFTSSPSSGSQAQGQYLGFIESGTTSPEGLKTGFDHLQELKVSHVHLLPIFDFATVDEANPQESYNWGYDPLQYNVPEGSYSSNPRDGRIRIREVKELVQALNQAKIGVIMDVVYNHSFHSLASALHKLVPGYYYRHHQDGRFSNGSGCGNELADERSMVRKFIVDSVCYWAREYKIAGFRFDLMGLHHLDTMRAIRTALDEINAEILIYGEGWAAAPSTLREEKRALKENTAKLPGIASFCNDLRDGVKGHVFETKQGGFIQGAGFGETVKFGIVGAIDHPQVDSSQILYSHQAWALEPSQAVLYVEAHDNLTLWDKLLASTEDLSQEERVKMMKLAHAIVLTSQGIPFLHAGQEFARTKGGDPNSYQSPDQVNQIDWSRKAEFLDLYEYTRDLILLRRKIPAFRFGRAQAVREKLQFLKPPAGNMVIYVLKPEADPQGFKKYVVIFNGNRKAVKVKVGAGPWQILLNSQGAGFNLGTMEGAKVWVEGSSPLILARR